MDRRELINRLYERQKGHSPFMDIRRAQAEMVRLLDDVDPTRPVKVSIDARGNVVLSGSNFNESHIFGRIGLGWVVFFLESRLYWVEVQP